MLSRNFFPLIGKELHILIDPTNLVLIIEDKTKIPYTLPFMEQTSFQAQLWTLTCVSGLGSPLESMTGSAATYTLSGVAELSLAMWERRFQTIIEGVGTAIGNLLNKT